MNRKNKPLILVTGAVGRTGSAVAEQMLERGFPVRALVRKLDDRSSRLEALGAEVLAGDLLDLQRVRQTLQGVKRVYFVYPAQGELLVEATSIIAVAARDASVEALVNMSQISARQDSASPLARQHWLSENILDWADIGSVHVRPTFFAENFAILGGATLWTHGKIYLPYGTEKHAPVSAADVGRVVSEILANPGHHVGKRYVLTGPRNISMADAAKVLSLELGTPVKHVDLPVEAWGEVLSGVEGVTDSLLAHFKAVAVDHQEGRFRGETNVVERIGGQKPQTLGAFVRKNRALFEAYRSVESKSAA